MEAKHLQLIWGLTGLICGDFLFTDLSEWNWNINSVYNTEFWWRLRWKSPVGGLDKLLEAVVVEHGVDFLLLVTVMQ